MQNTLHDESTNQPSGNIFSMIARWFRLEQGVTTNMMVKIIFCAFLGLLYIANAHHSDKVIRRTNKIKSEIEDLRTDYITLMANYMIASKQSEVALKVKFMGLKELAEPPMKLVLK